MSNYKGGQRHGRHPKTLNLKKVPLCTMWWGMKLRCSKPGIRGYRRYGGRGIRVCEEWLVYDNFVDWALANGWKPGLTIDRINSDGNYEPSNCQFLTLSENSSKTTSTEFKKASDRINVKKAHEANKRKIRCVETGEVFESFKAAGEHLGVWYTAVRGAVVNGWRCKGYHWEYVSE